jgi:hypothetical protein
MALSLVVIVTALLGGKFDELEIFIFSPIISLILSLLISFIISKLSKTDLKKNLKEVLLGSLSIFTLNLFYFPLNKLIDPVVGANFFKYSLFLTILSGIVKLIIDKLRIFNL